MNETYSQHALPLDAMVQEYRIVRVLGAGSFGIVYIAENKFFNESVALKEFLPTDIACRPEGTRVSPLSSETEETYRWALNKFLDEARTLRELGHPVSHRNIVRVRQFIETNDTAYMVMDYEEGRPLSRILDKRRTLPEEELKSILEPLLDGLERVHEANVWHRDVKPNNILIRPDGSPVLIDFGAARREVAGTDRSVMSQFTPTYAALEQVYAAGQQGPWTDIYALGATLYRAVTGEKPANATERFLQGAAYTPAIQAAEGNYSQTFLTAIDAALELKPQDRPKSITQWRGLLEGKPEPVVAEEEEATVVRPWRPEPVSITALAGAPGTVPESISKDKPITRGVGGRALAPKPDRQLANIVIVLVLAAALGFAVLLILWSSDGKNGPPGTILAQVQDALATLKCSAVNSTLSEERHLSISGFVSSTEDLHRIRDEMKSIEGVTSLKDNLVVHLWPFCEMLNLLHEYQNPDLSRELPTRLETGTPDGRYKEGEFLSVSVTTSKAFDGYLYIDYLDCKGNIVHMLPSPKRHENAVRTGQKIVVGAGGPEKSEAIYHYKIEPPNGRNMIVAITSRQPLFDISRPQIESATQYFSALVDALRIEKRMTSPAGVITAYQFFDTHR